MEKLHLPSKIEVTKGEKENEAVVSIQPCYPGYGTTLGNALRRVILSSLPGAAIIAFKVKGASHEFSAVNYVLEDLVEISLNLKQLRLKVHSDEPVRLKLSAKGEKKVTAKDITSDSNVEIINKDLLIATLTNKDAVLEMEFIAQQGRGYVPTEVQGKEELEVGMIALDAIYTPAKNVGFKVEPVRVGQMTNFENLILTIETDGTMTPEEALQQSTDILLDHFNFIAGQSTSLEPAKKVKKTKVSKKEAAKEEGEEESKAAVAEESSDDK